MLAVEAMIVCGLLAGGIAMLTRVHCCTELARETAASNDLTTLQDAIGSLEIDSDRELAESEGLAALIAAPPAAPTWWHGPYLRRDSGPVDPWGQPYVYHSPASGSRRLLSLGPDRKEGTADDVVVTLARYVPYGSKAAQNRPLPR